MAIYNAKSRINALLAKIAGYDDDISTFIPAVPVSEEEKLLAKIAERLDGIESGGSGGGSDAGIIFLSGNDLVLPKLNGKDSETMFGFVPENKEKTRAGSQTSDMAFIYQCDKLNDVSMPLAISYLTEKGDGVRSSTIIEEIQYIDIYAVTPEYNDILYLTQDTTCIYFDSGSGVEFYVIPGNVQLAAGTKPRSEAG